MAARRCPRCRRRALHRIPRSRAQRLLAYLLPIRPYRCTACERSSWGFIGSGDGRLPWLTSPLALTSIVGLVVVAVIWVRIELQPNPNQPVALKMESRLTVQPERTAEPMPEPNRRLAAGESQPMLVAPSATPLPTPAAEPEPTPAPIPAPRPPALRKLVLDALEVKRVGEIMEIRLAVSGGEPVYSITEYEPAGGFVIELAGRWQLPAGLRSSRTFTRTPLQSLRIGQHPDHLRLVIGLRGTPRRQPQIRVTDDGLLIRVI